MNSLLPFWDWLTLPSIAPWQGLLAAVVALLLIHVPIWPVRAKSLKGKVARLIVLFLLVLWFLQLCLGTGSGSGSGTGSGSGDGPGEGTSSGVPSLTSQPGEMPQGVPVQVRLLIRFVPTVNDPNTASDFACDLIYREEQQTKKIEIRAKQMNQFDRLLVDQLKRIAQVQTDKNLEARILKKPFPGEGVLRRVREKIQTVLPDWKVILESS